MSEREGTLHLKEGKIYLDGVLLRSTPIMRENIFAHFSDGERVRVEFHDKGLTKGYIKSMVLVWGIPDIERS